MFLRKLTLAFASLVSIFSSVDTPGVDVSSALLPFLPTLVIIPEVVRTFPICLFNEEPISIGFSRANWTTPSVIGIPTLDWGASHLAHVQDHNVSVTDWEKWLIVAGEVFQEGNVDYLVYVLHEAQQYLVSVQFNISDLECLVFLLDVSFVELVTVLALLILMESSPFFECAFRKVLSMRRQILYVVDESMILAGVLLATWPRILCQTLGSLIPIVASQVLYLLIKFDRFLTLGIDALTIRPILVLSSNAVIVGSKLGIIIRGIALQNLHVTKSIRSSLSTTFRAIIHELSSKSYCLFSMVRTALVLSIFIIVWLSYKTAMSITDKVHPLAIKLHHFLGLTAIRVFTVTWITNKTSTLGITTARPLANHTRRFKATISALIKNRIKAFLFTITFEGATLLFEVANHEFVEKLTCSGLAKVESTHQPNTDTDAELPAPTPYIRQSTRTREKKRYRRGKQVKIDLGEKKKHGRKRA
ncbi:hypothetical protein MIND_01104000 [Mycena indigotica]|uniref:Uncharacterized protein n=1 Tax=Mycena indigotica TaxID=2126181 RepID=A0A8H6VZ57_9AGAR|nr:uncharacterized protein MIND_01104000 [Mycena indigotica]KAF7295638.1 hypothetical protein MIND_01104000 [Mycena indigotica]